MIHSYMLIVKSLVIHTVHNQFLRQQKVPDNDQEPRINDRACFGSVPRMLIRYSMLTCVLVSLSSDTGEKGVSDAIPSLGSQPPPLHLKLLLTRLPDNSSLRRQNGFDA